MLNALRHQRFGTPLLASLAGIAISCSTPYGIRGLAHDCPYPCKTTELLVLNALRHQRFGTTKFGSLAAAALNCAQRLTASEVWHTPYLFLGSVIGRTVLNALRHQRFGTMLLRLGRLGVKACAQRLTASEVWHSPK